MAMVLGMWILISRLGGLDGWLGCRRKAHHPTLGFPAQQGTDTDLPSQQKHWVYTLWLWKGEQPIASQALSSSYSSDMYLAHTVTPSVMLSANEIQMLLPWGSAWGHRPPNRLPAVAWCIPEEGLSMLMHSPDTTQYLVRTLFWAKHEPGACSLLQPLIVSHCKSRYHSS